MANNNPFTPAFVSTASSGTTLVVPAQPGQVIKVLALHAMSAAAQNIQFFSNATACSGLFPVAANGGWVWPAGILPVNMSKGTFLYAPWAQTNVGEALNVSLSAATQTGIQLIWVAD